MTEFKFEYVLYIIYGVLALIMIVDLLKGLIQGSRKGFFNLIMTVVFWVGYFVLLTLIPTRDVFSSPGLFSFAQSLGLPMPEVAEGVEINNFVDYLTYLLAPILGESMGMDVTGNPELMASVMDMILCIGDALVRLLIIIPLTLVHAIVKAVIYNLLVARFCETSKRKLRKLEKKNDKYFDYYHRENPTYTRKIDRIEKNRARLVITRPLGMLMGAARGFVACFILMAFINALAFTVPALPNISASEGATAYVYAEETVEDTDETVAKTYTAEEKGLAVYRLLDALELGEVARYISMYQNSLAAQFTRIPVGDTTLDKFFVDKIFIGVANDTQLTIRKDIEAVIDGLATGIAVFNDRTADGEESIWKKMMNGEGSGINYLELFTSGPAIEFAPVITNLFDTSIFKNFLPIVIEYMKSVDLSGAGEEVPAFSLNDLLDPTMTQAEDWKNELTNLLTAIDDITESGKRPIREFNPETFDFSQLANLKTRTLLNSRALSYVLIGMLISGANGDGIFGDALKDFVAMPDALTVKNENGGYAEAWYSRNGDSSKGELAILFDTIKSIIREIGNLNSITDSIPKLVSGLADSGFEKSEVLRCSITKLFEGDMLGSAIIVPDEAYDSEKMTIAGEEKNVLSGTELKNAVDGIAELLDPEAETFDFTNISLGNVANSAEKLFRSKIIQATISHYLQSDSLGEIVVIPEDAYEKTLGGDIKTITVGGVEEPLIDGGEMAKAFKGLGDILGDITINNIDIEGVTLGRIAAAVKNPDESSSQEDLLDSKILQATVSHLLSGEMLGDVVVIPDEVYERNADETIKMIPVKKKQIVGDVETTVTVWEKLISADEIRYVVKAIGSVMGDVSISSFDLSSMTFGRISDSVDDLVKSKIVHATVSKLITDLDSILTIDSAVMNGEYIETNELKNAVRGITGILGRDNSISDLSFDIGEMLEKTDELKASFDSSIIRTTVTKLISDIGIVVVPDDVGPLYTDINGIVNRTATKEELSKLVDAFAALEEKVNEGKPEAEKVTGTDLFNMDNFSLGVLSDNALLNSLLDSKIVHATISDLMVGQKATIVIPSSLYDGTYIDSAEIRKLVSGLAGILGENGQINNVSSLLDINKILSDTTALKSALDSDIIRATATKFLSGVTAVTIPEDVTEEIKDIDNVDANPVTKAEFIKLVDAYDAMKNKINEGRAPGTELSGEAIFNTSNLTLGMLNDDSLLDTMFDSKIVQGTISSVLIGNSQIKVGVDGEYHALDNTVLYDGTYILKAELKKFFKSVSIVSSGSVDLVSIDSSALLGLSDEEIEQLFASEIVVNTVSAKIYALFSVGSLEFLTTAINPTYGFTERTVTAQEEIALYKAISIFGSGDLDALSISFERLTELTNDEIETICVSNLISYNAYIQIKNHNHTLLSDMLIIDKGSAEYLTERNWYYTGTMNNNDLYSLIVSMKKMYGNETFKNLLEGSPLSSGASLEAFKSDNFIEAMTDSKVLCDSIPNILEKITSALTNSAGTIEVTQRDAKDAMEQYIYDDASWKNYWAGSSGHASGELYKLFNGIEAINYIYANHGSMSSAQLIEKSNIALQSDIISKSIAKGVLSIDPE